jgi:transcriptional regulator with XRE-family HTH domain
VDKRELGDFLRHRRERLTPATVGLPADGPRRTPGLRREEVAQLAHISAQYYTRLEQARGPRPSRPVLASIGRALRLTDAERDHFYTLAGEPVDAPGPSGEVPANVVELLERLPDTAVLVLDAKYEVLAWNPLAAALFEDFSARPRRERNMIRRYFLDPDPGTRHYGIVDNGEFGRFAAGHLRAAAARYPDDPGVRGLVRELLRESPDFAERWDSGEVHAARHMDKTIVHPQVGPIELSCDVLVVPEHDQHVTLFTAAAGTPGHEALRLLSVIGLQRMDVPD